MVQTTLPAGRVGQVEQERAYAADALLEAGTPAQIGIVVRYLVRNQKRLTARNAALEASSRVYAAGNFR